MEKDKTIQTGISLYELNKMMMKQLPPQPERILKSKLISIGDWFSVAPLDQKWFMLLCREKTDYTLIHFKNFDFNKGIEELKECIENRGQLFAIDYLHGENAYEIWIKEPETKEVNLYMLFNCTPMVIEV